MTGGNRWSASEGGFRRHLEDEFIDLAGRFVPCRSSYSGVALPMIGGAQPQAMPCFFLNATMPEIALRHWLLLRRDLVKARSSGHALEHRLFWRTDTGNYRFSRASAFAGTALAAVELGDGEVARLCLDALERECPAVDEADTFYRPNASVWSHAVEFFARSGTENGFRRLIERPREPASGVLINDIPYPDVLVARATHAQGVLTAVLYPGERAGRFRLGLAGLAAGGRYSCDGTEESSIKADRLGQAAITVALADRTEIRVRPRA